MISEQQLRDSYIAKKMSMMDIAKKLDCSAHKVVYYMDKHGIKRRSISEAIYQKHNPNGDPFSIKPIKTIEDAKLLGLGIGLYWGEGAKTNRHSIRLGNTDPELIKHFIKFLTNLLGFNKENLKFGLQIFTDINPKQVLAFWVNQLGVKPSQFYKITVTISGSIGTYRNKSQYGVLTVHCHNKKLRDIMVGMLPR